MSETMSDEELLDYARTHCLTPRPLFHKNHVVRLLLMAGQNEKAERIRTDTLDIYPIGPSDMSILIDQIIRARKKVEALNVVEIKKLDGIIGTDALWLAVLGWENLMADSLVPNYISMVDWEAEAFVAYRNGRPVGLITFKYMKWNNTMVITHGYVLPPCRRQGIYTQLWNALVLDAQERSVPRIMSETSTHNIGLRAHAEKCGRTEPRVVLEFLVPKKGEPC